MDRHKYLLILEEQIREKRARAMVVREIEEHIEDQKEAFLAEGMTEEEAEIAAVQEMGDPVEAGVALDRVHKPKMEWRVFVGVLLMSLLGIFLQAVVSSTLGSADSAGQILWAVANVSRRHLAAIIVGIPLMLLICLVDYSVLYKYVSQLWGLVVMIFVACMLFGPMVNGRTAYLMQCSYLFPPVYAGVVYYYRGQGEKGLWKSLWCFLAMLIMLVCGRLVFQALVVGVTGIVILHVVIHRRWFGTDRKRLYTRLWCFLGMLALLAVGVLLFTRGVKGTEVFMERLVPWAQALQDPGAYAEYEVIPQAIVEAGTEVKQQNTYLAGNLLSFIQNDYLWLYLSKSMETWKMVVLTLTVVGFWGMLFYIVCRQKNQLGYLVGITCVLFLSLQSVAYMAMNFHLLPSASVYMPFLSNGSSYLMITYCYMGLILSVCRNERLVRN